MNDKVELFSCINFLPLRNLSFDVDRAHGVFVPSRNFAKIRFELTWIKCLGIILFFLLSKFVDDRFCEAKQVQRLVNFLWMQLDLEIIRKDIFCNNFLGCLFRILYRSDFVFQVDTYARFNDESLRFYT